MWILRIGCWPALPVVMLLAGLSAAAAGGDPRELCVSDAIRFCNDFIPDVPKVTACMLRNKPRLSAPCRNAMHSGYRHGGAHHHYYHRGARHCRHCR